jgi:hypothetical protein
MKAIKRYKQELMVSIVSFLVIPILIPSSTSAQQQSEPVAVATPKGIFIYLGNVIPKQSYYEVELKSDRNNYTKLATIRVPENQQAMEARIKEHRIYFDNLDPLTEPEEEKLWNYVNTSSSMNSLYIPNLPLMNLVAGTAYFDKQTNTGKEYQYRVKLYHSDGTLVHQNETNKVRMPSIPNLLKPDFKDKRESTHQVLLQWYVPEQRQLSSYSVFRRVFGQGEFLKADVIKGFNTHEDSVFFIVIDTAIHNPSFYEYYVLPLDAYGNAGPASDPVGAGTMGEKYIPVLQRFKGRSTGNDHEVSLSWQFENKKYLRSLELYRSIYYDSGFVKIATLPPSDTSYIDHLSQGSENYYYYIVLNAPFGKSYPSTIISVLYRDTTILQPPAEVAAETINNGLRVHWLYEEPFVKGFLVYRSEYPDKDFKVISDVIPFEAKVLSYTDTSRVLLGNQPYYYAIEAISDSDISSALSTTANGLPGVKTKISSPRHVNVQWDDEAVLISWDDLSEIEDDLRGYAVYRKQNGDEFQLIYEQQDGRTKNYFYDTQAEPGKTYQYAVLAEDFFGGKSSLSSAVSFQVPVIKLVAPSWVTLSGTREGIHIAWGQVSASNLNRLLLYRQEVGQTPTRIATLEKDQLDYLDKTAERGKLYSYYLTSEDTKNVESNPGQLSTIRY